MNLNGLPIPICLEMLYKQGRWSATHDNVPLGRRGGGRPTVSDWGQLSLHKPAFQAGLCFNWGRLRDLVSPDIEESL